MPELEKKLADARRQAQALERRLADARQTVERQNAAVENLRKLAPQSVRDKYTRALAALRPQRSELATLRATIGNIEALERIDVNTAAGRQVARPIALRDYPAAAAERAVDGVDPNRWRAYVEREMGTLDTLRGRADELRKQIETGEVAAAKLLDVYAN